MVCLRLYSLLGIAGYAGLDGGLRAMGRSREELLGATPIGAAGRRPNRGCGPRAAAEAARRNVTKPLLRLLFYSSLCLTSGSDMCAAEDTR